MFGLESASAISHATVQNFQQKLHFRAFKFWEGAWRISERIDITIFFLDLYQYCSGNSTDLVSLFILSSSCQAQMSAMLKLVEKATGKLTLLRFG